MSNTQNNMESEQVEVSASKLQMLVSKHHESKEKYLMEIAQLKAQIRARDEQINLYDNAILKLKLKKDTRSTKTGDNTRKVLEELNRTRQFDEWIEKNKDRLVDEEYNKNYKADVDLLRHKLIQLVDN